MAETTTADRAGLTIWGLLVFGAIAAFGGAYMAVANEADTTTTAFGTIADSGNSDLRALGLILAAGGSIALTIGCVALGVLLGTQAARRL